MLRWRLLLWILVLAAWPQAGWAREDGAISVAIAELSDRDAAVRERASALLWSAGRSAEPALRQVLSCDDPEAVSRARSILARIELGLYPDTPPQVLDLVQQYRLGGFEAKQNVVAGLANQGNRGLRVLLGLRHFEHDVALRDLIVHAIGARPHERDGAALILTDGDVPSALELLKAAAEESEASTRDWAALLLLRGGLNEQIVATREEAKLSPDGRPATRLAYLARAKGDFALAALAADEADDPHLVDSVLIEARDWKRLALRYRDKVGSTSETLGFAAAFYRLSGDREAFESAAAALRNFADHHDEEYWNCAECLMLNDRVDEGVAVLTSHKNHLATMDFLLPRLRFKEALSLPQRCRNDLKPNELLQLRARAVAAYHFTGDRAAGAKAIAAIRAENQTLKDLQTDLLLADAARQLDLPDQADALLDDAMELPGAGDGSVVLDKAALPDGFPAPFWWKILRGSDDATRPYAFTLHRLRALSSGQFSDAQLQALVDQTQKDLARHAAPLDRERALQSIAKTLDLLGRRELAENIYRKLAELYPSNTALQSVGDCEAARGDYSRAAITYQRAWDIDRTRAAPLALYGWALLKTGDAVHARQAIDLAHLLPLGDENQRTTLEEIFRKHDLPNDARTERDLILKTGSFLSWDVCNANRLCGDDASAHGDYLAAADYWEKAFLGNLQLNTSFLEPWANVMIPVMIHKTRAMGLIKHSPAAALHEAQLAMTEAPSDANVLIDLVLAFEQAAHKPEADALFSPTARLYASLCEEFPASGPAHNQLAWIEARCHRNLDDALKQGLRAVEIEPKNTASIDTLAEVYFERGEIDQAIAQMNTCVKLEPNVPRHREQIARFSAARKK